MVKGLYIHIPFCDNICFYCDFPKRVATNILKEKYINSLLSEFEYYKDYYSDIETIYIGGGTPTSIDVNLLEKLFAQINNYINIENIKEFTLETNPNNLTKKHVELFRLYGVNRVSLGVQTFNSKLLKRLGRSHTNQDVYNSIKLLKAKDIDNINIDMIFSIPGQTIDDLYSDIYKLSDLNISHISYYSLILEEKTVFYNLYKKNKLKLTEEEIEANMYEIITEELSKKGFTQYEISNYAKNNNYSKHNLLYWKNKEYIGLGMGAHGYIDGKRYSNSRTVTDYIEKVNKTQRGFDKFYPCDKLSEELILGLRLIDGINIEKTNRKYKIDLLEKYSDISKHIEYKSLVIENGRLKLTKKGLLLANLVFEIFV